MSHTRGVSRTLNFNIKQFELDPELKHIHEICEKTLPVYKRRLTDLQEQHNTMTTHHNPYTNGPFTPSSSTNNTRTYKSDYILKCPVGDCKGFVGTNLQCRLCDMKICKHCHETRDEEHECKPEDIQSATLIKESTRPCPKCATRIHRISGCTQMWCTQCNTSFDYRTGVVYTLNIHNPHYFEWLQRNPQPDEEVPTTQRNGCMELSLARYLFHVRRALHVHNHDEPNTCNTMYNLLVKMCRDYYHMQHVITTYDYVENEDREPFNYNLRLRISWMRNQISDQQFKNVLQRREKQLFADVRRHQVLQTCSQVVRDQCDIILNSGYTDQAWKNCISRYQNIMTYGDECFEQLRRMYTMKMPNHRS